MTDVSVPLSQPVESTLDPLSEAEQTAQRFEPPPPPPDACPAIVSWIGPATETMLRRARGEEQPVPLPWPSLTSRLHGGLWPGLYVLVSTTGVGKTQWALQTALCAAQRELDLSRETEQLARRNGVNTVVDPRPVVYVALELGPTDMVARSLGLLASGAGMHVKWSELAFGRSRELTSVLNRFNPVLSALPLRVEIAPPHGWDASNLARIAQLNPRVVVIDFLQLIARQPREDLREAMTRASYAARALARDHGCVVLALSSTARANYSTVAGRSDTGKKELPPWERDPAEFVGMGKESGDIEFASDGVMVLISEPPSETSSVRTMHLGLAKNRSGLTGWLPLRFDGSRFEEGTSEELDL